MSTETASTTASRPVRPSESTARVALLVGFLGLAALAAFWPQLSGQLGFPIPPGAENGDPVPTFAVATLAGESLTFPDDFGQDLVLLDFWATWCPPCVADFPVLREAAAEFHGQGVQFVSISLDAPRLGRDALTDYVAQRELDWIQVLDERHQLGQLFDVTSIPHKLLVDPRRRVVVASGAELDGPALRRTLARRLENRFVE